MQIQIEREKLLGILEENKKKHLKEYHDALQGWRIGLSIELQKKAAELDETKDTKLLAKVEVNFYNYTKPSLHSRDYDRAIGMVTMHDGATVSLALKDYENFILDEWGWKGSFTESVEVYSPLFLSSEVGKN